MAPVARLDMDIRAHGDPLEGAGLAGRAERVDCYRLADVDLKAYAGLVVPAMVDQDHLARHRAVIDDYLEGGGVVVFGGHLHRDWLAGASAFVPLEAPTLAGYQVTFVADHPVFAGVDNADLTYRRGVAGFFARGHHPPPAGAEVLTRLAGGQPATYVDEVSTAGTVLVQSSCDLLGYAGGPASTAARIPGQLLDWIAAQGCRRGRPPARRRPPASTAGAAPVLSPRRTRLTPAGRLPSAGAPGAAPALGGVGPAAHPAGLAAVYGGSAPHHRALAAPKYAAHLAGGLVHLADLAATDLRPYAGLVIPERLHRGLLARAAPRILDLLDAGGTVIAFAGGEPPPEFLPGVRWEHRPTNYWWWLEPGADLGLHSPTPGHALFDHLGLADCTWHHHGVLDPPSGAEVLVALPSGEALLYLDEVSTPGTLVVATLDPISHYGSYFMPATERFLDGFLPWAANHVAGSNRRSRC